MFVFVYSHIRIMHFYFIIYDNNCDFLPTIAEIESKTVDLLECGNFCFFFGL